MKKLMIASMAAACVLSGCSDDNGTGIGGEVITLTASQAAALVGRIEGFGASDPNLAALADTVDVVIKAGAEARRVNITNDAGASAFYAVSLDQEFHGANNASANLHIIAFNDPTNPSLLVILGGSIIGASTTAPLNTASGPIGANGNMSLTGHLFSISGTQVQTWNASGGTSYMTAGATAQACTGFAGPGTCVKSTMDASFTITASVAGNNTTGSRTWSGDISNVPGIKLSN